jgi:hypothetical protein
MSLIERQVEATQKENAIINDWLIILIKRLWLLKKLSQLQEVPLK